MVLTLSNAYPQQESSAASIKTEPEEPISKVLFSVYVQAPDAILREDSTPVGLPRLFYDSPTGLAYIPVYRGASTPLYPYQGPQPLTLYDIKVVREDPPEGSPPGTMPIAVQQKVPLINAEFNDQVDRVLIIVFAGTQGAYGTLRSVVLPYSTQTLKTGMSRIYNGTNKPYFLQFVSTENPIHKLEPNGVFDFTPSRISDSDYPRIYVYGSDDTGEVKGVHTSKLFLKQNTTNIFLLHTRGNRRVGIMPIGAHENLETGALFPTP